MARAWLQTALVMAVSLPALFALSQEILEKENYFALAGLLLALMALGFLIRALRLTLRWKRFGKSVVWSP
jgi:hypothetical protein